MKNKPLNNTVKPNSHERIAPERNTQTKSYKTIPNVGENGCLATMYFIKASIDISE